MWIHECVRGGGTMMLIRRWLMVSILAATACSGGGTMPGDGGVPCRTDLDCDDGHECTIDSCGVSGTCRFDEIDERCPDGQLCEAGRGCVSSATCSSDAECDDAIECTIDSCGVGGICSHRPVNERCGAGETCDVATGCTAPTGCSSDAECDDGVACTRDSCTVDRRCNNLALDELCDTAAGERCNQTRGCFTSRPCTTAADCDDGNFCNGAEVCIPEFGCEPAAAPRACDDSEDCTVDRCDAALDMCVFECDRSRPECGCPVTGPTCTGRFAVTPIQSDVCACDSSGCQVDYDLGEVTFAVVAGVLRVTPRRAHFTALSDTTAPVCPSFQAVAEVGGGFPERFTLQGTFTDDDNFTGTFSADYGGFGILAGCREGSFAVTGTRIP